MEILNLKIALAMWNYLINFYNEPDI
jgi:hypothetical protein